MIRAVPCRAFREKSLIDYVISLKTLVFVDLRSNLEYLSVDSWINLSEKFRLSKEGPESKYDQNIGE